MIISLMDASCIAVVDIQGEYVQLGKKNLPSLTQVCPFPEDRVDLSVFSPVCLPSNGADFIGQTASVYGEEL